MRALLKRTHSKIQRLADEEEEPTSESLEKMTTLLASEDDIQNGITEILMSGIRRYTGGGKLLSNGTHVAIVSEGRVLGVTELTSDPQRCRTSLRVDGLSLYQTWPRSLAHESAGF